MLIAGLSSRLFLVLSLLSGGALEELIGLEHPLLGCQFGNTFVFVRFCGIHKALLVYGSVADH